MNHSYSFHRIAKANMPKLRLVCQVIVVALFSTIAWETSQADTAMLYLRSQCESHGHIITIGDVLRLDEIGPSEAERLAAIDLRPAPLPGRQCFIHLQEIEERLRSRGVNLTQYQFSGARQVTVSSPRLQTKTKKRKTVSPLVARHTNRIVSEAIIRYLQTQTSNSMPWTVEVSLNSSYVSLFSGVKPDDIAVRGGRAPWLGVQRFEVALPVQVGVSKFVVDAQVSQPLAVVIAIRSLARGAVIREGDVKLQHLTSKNKLADTCHSLEEVLGKQTTQAIGKGRVLQLKAIRAPLLVHRGRAVTVYARSAGIVVRTVAWARDDGSLGDLVAVESQSNRKRYFARVRGYEEVEVYARAMQTAPDRQAVRQPRDQSNRLQVRNVNGGVR